MYSAREFFLMISIHFFRFTYMPKYFVAWAWAALETNLMMLHHHHHGRSRSRSRGCLSVAIRLTVYLLAPSLRDIAGTV